MTGSHHSPPSRRRRTNHALALLRLLCLLSWTGLMYGAYLIWRWSRSRERRLAGTPDWVRVWARVTVQIAGVGIEGQPPLPPRGVLLCPNHLGYVDVLALAAILPCYFASRADAASWPLIGRLIRASEQVLVSRRRSKDLADSSTLIAERLNHGQTVVVFLEGTSTGGDRLLPFLPALLQPAIEASAAVAPAGLRWETSLPGTTVARDVAYWGDHQFPWHLWRFLGLRGRRVRISFGQPISAEGRNRKELAAELHARVSQLALGQVRSHNGDFTPAHPENHDAQHQHNNR